MEAKGQEIHVFLNFVDLSGLYIFMFNYSHAFYFIYTVSHFSYAPLLK